MQRFKTTYRLGLATALFVLAFLYAGTGVASAAVQNITLSPTSFDQVLKPDSKNAGTVEIINSGETTFSFTSYASAYSVSGEDYKQDFTPLPGAPDVASWFQIGLRKATLEPGKLATIPYTITVPKNTPAGGYYAVLFAQTQAPPTREGVIVTDRVGAIFYVTIDGPLTKKGTVASWQTNFLQKPPLESTLRLENSGTTHFLATTHVVVKDVFGRTKLTYNTQKEVLPHTVRRLKIAWPATPAFGLFKVSGNVKFLDQNHTLATKYVLVMSQAVRLICLAVLILLTLGMIIRRFLKKKHAKRYTTLR